MKRSVDAPAIVLSAAALGILIVLIASQTSAGAWFSGWFGEWFSRWFG